MARHPRISKWRDHDLTVIDNYLDRKYRRRLPLREQPVPDSIAALAGDAFTPGPNVVTGIILSDSNSIYRAGLIHQGGDEDNLGIFVDSEGTDGGPAYKVASNSEGLQAWNPGKIMPPDAGAYSIFLKGFNSGVGSGAQFEYVMSVAVLNDDATPAYEERLVIRWEKDLSATVDYDSLRLYPDLANHPDVYCEIELDESEWQAEVWRLLIATWDYSKQQWSLKFGARQGTMTTGNPTIQHPNWQEFDKINFFTNYIGGYNLYHYTQWLSLGQKGAGQDFTTITSQETNFKYGDGSDGPHTVSGTEVILEDKYYSVLIIPTGQILKPNGYRIFCSEGLYLYGTIDASGDDGNDGDDGAVGGAGAAQVGGLNDGYLCGSANGGAGSAGGAGGNGGPGNNGTAGGAGANKADSEGVDGKVGAAGGGGGDATPLTGGTGGVAGTAGSATAPVTANYGRVRHFTGLVQWRYLPPAASPVRPNYSAGSGGGGGGGGGAGLNPPLDTGGTGGGGGSAGANGGFVFIAAKYIYVASSGVIDVSGGDGGNGGDGQDGSGGLGGMAGGGGGGGAGSGADGGLIAAMYEDIDVQGTIAYTGGTGGTGGSGGAGYGTGSNGQNGSNGTTAEDGECLGFTAPAPPAP